MIKKLLLYFALLLWFVVPIQAQPTILATDYTVDKNDIVKVDVVARNFEDLLGFQFAIDWDESVLEFVTISDFILPGAGAANYSISESGKLRIRWNNDSFSIPHNATLFTIHFKAIGAPKDETIIEFTDDTNTSSTPFIIEFIDGAGNLVQVNFENGSARINGTISSTQVIENKAVLHQNSPNPFHTNTHIIFELKETEDLTFSIFDTLGKEVYKRTAKYSVGQHHMNIRNTDLPASGVYIYHLRGEQYGLSKKLTFIK